MNFRPVLFLVAFVALVACFPTTAAASGRGGGCGHSHGVRYGWGGYGFGLAPFPPVVISEPPRRSPAFDRIWADYRPPQRTPAPAAIQGNVDRMPDYTPNPKMIENPFFKK